MPLIKTPEELKTALRQGEGKDLEFKADVNTDRKTFLKTVVAFANGIGGTIIFGIDDKTHAVTGFSASDVFFKMDALANSIADNCQPIITPDIDCFAVDDKTIIVVNIAEGSQKPYCYKPEGFLTGIYIRFAGTTRRATDYQQRELYFEQKRYSFDQTKTHQQISEQDVAHLCRRLLQHAETRRLDLRKEAPTRPIGKAQLIAEHLIHEDNGRLFASPGFQLLSGNLTEHPDARIRCALFKGLTRTVFIDRKEFDGPIDEQIESAVQFVLRHINRGARIDSLYRQDLYELPVDSIREIITNAVCHRSYLASGAIFVNIYDDRLEVISPGMLPSGLTVEAMIEGQSKIQNRGIAPMFAYMNLIEAWGSGIPRLFENCRIYGLPSPKITEQGTDVRVEIFRSPFKTDIHGVILPKPADKPHTTTQKDRLLQYLAEHPDAKIHDITQAFDCSGTTVKRQLSELKAAGKLTREGSLRRSRWVVLSTTV